MAAFLVLGTVVVFGGSIFDPSESDDPDPIDEAAQQVAELETRVAENPDDADSAAVLANIYANEGNLAGAIPLYERATIARPDDGDLRLAFGIALMRGGSYLDARIQLERALELLPDSAGPPYYLGVVAEQSDDPDLDAAREWYQLAIDTAPDSQLAEQAAIRLEELENAEPTATP